MEDKKKIKYENLRKNKFIPQGTFYTPSSNNYNIYTFSNIYKFCKQKYPKIYPENNFTKI
jgi:hypothetical protein